MRITDRNVALLVAVIATATTACSGRNPVATAAPPEARFDAELGSGNTAGTPSAENTTAADSGSTARGGGVFFGSGS